MMPDTHEDHPLGTCRNGLETFLTGAWLQELDVQEREHADYWSALAIICQAEEAIAARQDEIDRARLRGDPPPPAPKNHERGLHGAVAADLEIQLAGEPRPCQFPVLQRFSGRVCCRQSSA